MKNQAVIISALPVKIERVLGDGESAMQHPGGGWIIAHPDRKLLWCHIDDAGVYRQEFIDPICQA